MFLSFYLWRNIPMKQNPMYLQIIPIVGWGSHKGEKMMLMTAKNAMEMTLGEKL